MRSNNHTFVILHLFLEVAALLPHALVFILKSVNLCFEVLAPLLGLIEALHQLTIQLVLLIGEVLRAGELVLADAILQLLNTTP